MRSPRTGFFKAILTGIALLLTTCGAVRASAPAAGSLGDLVAQRLQLGREVAWTKFNLGLPIYDPGRENQLLTELTTQADIARINHDQARTFFAAQIAASRALQTEVIERWRAGARKPTTKPLNLVVEIRPKIDAVDLKLLSLLALLPATSHLLTPAELQRQLVSAGYSPIVAHLAATGLALR